MVIQDILSPFLSVLDSFTLTSTVTSYNSDNESKIIIRIQLSFYHTHTYIIAQLLIEALSLIHETFSAYYVLTSYFESHVYIFNSDV